MESLIKREKNGKYEKIFNYPILSLILFFLLVILPLKSSRHRRIFLVRPSRRPQLADSTNTAPLRRAPQPYTSLSPTPVAKFSSPPQLSSTIVTTIARALNLWWHAHSKWLRPTVYGAIVIYSKQGSKFPFPNPTHDVSMILGQWWKKDIIGLLKQALFSGGNPNNSDAYTINGQPGDLYQCSSKDLAERKTALADFRFPTTNQTRH